MGRWDEHKRVVAGAPAVIDARGRAAVTVGDLQLIDLRDAWLDAEEQAGAALRAWYSAARHEGKDAYAAYVAALDREEAAASLLASRLAILDGARV